MASEQPEYYRARAAEERAAEERAAAANAPTRSIFRFHDEMAAMYERQAKEAERDLEPAD